MRIEDAKPWVLYQAMQPKLVAWCRENMESPKSMSRRGLFDLPYSEAKNQDGVYLRTLPSHADKEIIK